MMETLKSCPFEEPVGKYEIENDKPMMTHEELLKSFSTDKMAEFLSVIDINRYDKQWWESWLKEKHNE
jgi:hypothetical protein